MDGDEALLERDLAHEVQEERLARAVGADDEAHAAAPVGDPLDVLEEGRDLVSAADLDVLEPAPRHDASAQRLEDRVADAGADGRLG